MTAIKTFIKTHATSIKHDILLFGAALAATGVLDTGAPLSRDAIAAAIVTAARRVIVELVTAGS